VNFEEHFSPRDIKKAKKILADIETDMKYFKLMLEKGSFQRAKDNLYNALYRVDEMMKMSAYQDGIKFFEYNSRKESINNAVTEALNKYETKQN
jgi:hypothetical protein